MKAKLVASAHDISADQEAVILRALAREPAPVTITTLFQAIPKPFQGKRAAFPAAIDRLASLGKLWLYPAGGKKTPKVWGRHPAVLAEAIVLTILAKGPLTELDIEKKTRAKIAFLSPTERRAVLQRLQADGRVFLWPRTPRGAALRLGITRPEPRDFLAKVLDDFAKAVSRVAAVLAEAGIPAAEVEAVAVEAVRLQHAVSQASGPLTDDVLLDIIAERMAEIDHRSRGGAPVLVSALRPALDFMLPTKEQFDEAFVRLERGNRLTLLRYDPSLSAPPLDGQQLISDGHLYYSGVALR